jgi:hypothetical protein
VPRLPELAVGSLLRDALKDKKLQKYLPDLTIEKENGEIDEVKLKTVNRQFLYNIINSIKPNFFPQNIRAVMEARKQ